MGRVKELDGLRGIAAITVIVAHLYPALWAIGFVGINIFFALSGYFITQSLQRRGASGQALKQYFLRRCRRIFPVYYLGLATSIVAAFIFREPIKWSAFWTYATFTQGLSQYWRWPYVDFLCMGHTWTLGVEQQFYLLAPLSFLLNKNHRPFLMMALIGFFFGLGITGQLINLLVSSWLSLLAGVLLAYYVEEISGIKTAALIFIGCDLIYIAPLLFVFGPKAGEMSHLKNSFPELAMVSGLGIAIVALCLASPEKAKWTGFFPLPQLGQVSYGLYLYHLIVDWIITLAIKPAPPREVGVVVSLVLAFLSWHYFERQWLAPKVAKTNTDLLSNSAPLGYPARRKSQLP